MTGTNKAIRLAVMALAKLNGRELAVSDYMDMFNVDRSQYSRDLPDVAKVLEQMQALWHSAGMTPYRQVQLTYASSDRVIFRCSACGAEWWEPYTETLRLAQYQEQPDKHGNHFPNVGTFEVSGRKEWHLPTCPLFEETPG